MKIKIEIDESLNEDEVTIKTNKLDDHIKRIQTALNEISSNKQVLSLMHNGSEYFVELEKIIFFETGDSGVCAHTTDAVYESKYKLYELEDILPSYFMRVSKSTILNVNQVFSINRNVSASSIVEFHNTHKQVYVSRMYYKQLKEKLDEKRFR